MTLWSVELHPDAAAEVSAAVQWYRERSETAADAFVAELDRAMEKIADSPEMWPKYVRKTQRFLLRHFPFGVVYRKKPGKIQILAMAHARRKPAYWKNRMA
jgi:toxin ParE1/3/4